MKRSDFHFDLPEQLIARYPAPERGGSRLLCLDGKGGDIRHRQFAELTELLKPADLLVFNDTRVIPARLFGAKSTGGKVEILLERITSNNTALAHVKASKSPKPGAIIALYDRQGEDAGASLAVSGRQGELFQLEFGGQDIFPLLDKIGHVPLPPYIDRADEAADLDRYQTVYARQPGAVAAPTAGLHFDQGLLASLAAKGINSAFVTLHVGAGTFQPVRADDIADHVMHSEYIEVSQSVCEQVEATVRGGGRVVAVGTTSVRCLESAARDGQITPYTGDTNIFIYPGYQFQCVDALVTNFHLPESTLIMLVSAFAGREQVLAAYGAAVAQNYRFFSYGDAMWITGGKESLMRQRLESGNGA